jgi:hypothetical protein
MACEALSYSRVDAVTWARVKETIEREYGIAIAADEGQESKRGFTLRWSYEPEQATLEIQCLEKPFITPCAVVNGYINSAAAKSGVGQ